MSIKEKLLTSTIYIWVAGLYFYHLGAWTYRAGIEKWYSNIPPEIVMTSIIYIIIILIFFVSGITYFLKKKSNPYLYLVLISPAAIYEIYRIAEMLYFYSVSDKVLFFYHLGIRLGLLVAVAMAIIITIYQGKRFNKTLQPDA